MADKTIAIKAEGIDKELILGLLTKKEYRKVKRLFESGNILEAQKIILGKLSKQSELNKQNG